MATDQGGQPRRPIEPLVDVVTDGVALGYQALELVVEGLKESLRIQSQAGPATPPYRRTARGYGGGRATYGGPGRARGGYAQPAVGLGQQQGGEPPTAGAGAAASSGALIGDLARIASELLSRAGAVAGEVASLASARSGAAAGPSGIPELKVQEQPGACAKLPFQVWNTGPTALRNVVLNATDLIGPERSSIAGGVTFQPDVIERISPGRHAPVEIAIEVPEGTSPGDYRGLVQAEPGGICAVLVVGVVEPSKQARS